MTEQDRSMKMHSDIQIARKMTTLRSHRRPICVVRFDWLDRGSPGCCG
jgi:hypothetical protein